MPLSERDEGVVERLLARDDLDASRTEVVDALTASNCARARISQAALALPVRQSKLKSGSLSRLLVLPLSPSL